MNVQNLNINELTILLQTIKTRFEIEHIKGITELKYLFEDDSELEYKCSPYSSSEGFTHLHKCVLRTNDYPILNSYIEGLLKNNQNMINEQNKNVWTALMLASRNANTVSSERTVEILIENGAKVNIQNCFGATALHYAVTNSQTDSTESVVKLLLDHGSDIFIKDTEGRNVILHAIENYDTWSTESTLKMILDHFQDHDINVGGQKLIKLLFDSGVDTDIIKASIAKGAKVNDLLSYRLLKFFN